MHPNEPSEKNVKRSVSIPADLWKWLERKKGKYGVASKVVQEALRRMRESDP